MVSGAKTRDNPESTVGILTMAGDRVEVLAAPTDDMGKLLAATSDIEARGAANFVAALQVAQLALKHRKNKNGGQRVVMFIGSPLAGVEEKRFVRVGKQLKKNTPKVSLFFG